MTIKKPSFSAPGHPRKVFVLRSVHNARVHTFRSLVGLVKNESFPKLGVSVLWGPVPIVKL